MTDHHSEHHHKHDAAKHDAAKHDTAKHDIEKDSESVSFDSTSVAKFFKEKWPLLVLSFLILVSLFGTFFLFGEYKTSGRVFNLDAPSIGYHNMKENEYLSQAVNMPVNHDYFRRIMHIFGMESGPGYFEEYPQMPILPWMFLISWGIFGFHFWAARIIIVLFSLGSVVLIYLLAKKLTKDNEFVSILAAALFSILPLGVFFGRNIQPEMPALFGILFAMYFFVRWIDSWKTSDIAWSAFGFMLAGQFKPTFFICVIPLLVIFPYKDFFARMKHHKEKFLFLKQAGIFVLILLPFILWNFVISAMLNTKQGLLVGTFGRVSLFRIFSSSYWVDAWPALNAYIRDNYAVWYLAFAVLGILFILFTRPKSRLSKFFVAYAIAIIPYFMILADYVKGHSYYQMPFLPLICIAAAYFIFAVCDVGRQVLLQKSFNGFFGFALVYSVILAVIFAVVRNYVAKYLPFKSSLFVGSLYVFLFMIVLLFLFFGIAKWFSNTKVFGAKSFMIIISISMIIMTLPAVKAFTDAQYNTIFYGLDGVGDYMKKNSVPTDRLFWEGHAQSLGACFNSDRRCGAAANLSDIIYGESELNFSWYFLHGDVGINNLYNKKDVFPYVQDNYELVQVTFISQDGKSLSRPTTYLLKKGGRSDLLNLSNNRVFQQQISLFKTYQTAHGPVYLLSAQVQR